MNGLRRLHKIHKSRQSKGPIKSKIVDYQMINFHLPSKLIKIINSNMKTWNTLNSTNLNLIVNSKFLNQNTAMMFKLVQQVTTYNKNRNGSSSLKDQF